MKKNSIKPLRARMKEEYDFSNGERGKHTRRYVVEGTNVVILEPDVAKALPNSKSVSVSLRKIMRQRVAAEAAR